MGDGSGKAGALFRILGYLLTAAFLVWAVYFVSTQEEGLQRLAASDPRPIAMIFLAHGFFLFVNGVFLKVIMARFGVPMRLGECFHVSVLTTAGNNFLPMTSGMAIRGFYLKKRYDFPIVKFIGTVAGNYILNYFVVFLVGSLCSLVIWLRTGVTNPFINTLMVGGALGFAVPIFLDTRIPRLSWRHWGKVEAILDSWRHLKGDKLLVVKLAGLTLANVVGSTVTLYFAFDAIGEPPAILPLVYIVVLSTLSLFMKITPGNIGVTEGLMLLGGGVFAIDMTQVLVAALLMRITLYLLCLVGFPLSMYRLFRGNSLEAWRQMKGEAPVESPVESPMES